MWKKNKLVGKKAYDLKLGFGFIKGQKLELLV
jgi:hypothetical protein